MKNISKESRNIIDFYHYWKTDAIKADLDKKRHPFAVMCCNFAGDFNIGGVIRSSNAFLGSQIYIFGRRKYDKRGAVGTFNYEHITHIWSLEKLKELKNIYSFVVVDNIEGSEPIESFDWPENPLLIFGEEQIGTPSEIRCMADHIVYIKQYGSVRSLNVASAASIAMYDWCRKNSM